MHRGLLAILLTLVSALTLSSQELEWSVDMNAVFNNREGGDEETPDQTFIFTRITPQIGVSMDSARHRIMGGVTWYQPMNDHLHGYKVLPSLYYMYKDDKKGYKFAIGVIPDAIKMPKFLQSDSLNYVNPNIKGFMIDVHKPHFYFLSWLNWRQLRTKNHREAFDVTGQVFWLKHFNENNSLKAGGLVRYNHLAKSYDYSDPTQGVVDNFNINPQVEYSHQWNNGYFGATAGILISCDHDRHFPKWHKPVGFLGNLKGNWKWITINEDIYAGDRQMPLYDNFSTLLYQGDQFYHNKFYSRTDLIATIFNRDYLNLEVKLTYHVTEKVTAFWQQLAVRFYLDKNLWKQYRNKKKGGDYLPLQPLF